MRRRKRRQRGCGVLAYFHVIYIMRDSAEMAIEVHLASSQPYRTVLWKKKSFRIGITSFNSLPRFRLTSGKAVAVLSGSTPSQKESRR